MSTETIIMHSIARRLDAGTYRPRPQHTVRVISSRPTRAYVYEMTACAVISAIMGWMLGGGL